MRSEIPVGAGLGSSAAYAAAISLALNICFLHSLKLPIEGPMTDEALDFTNFMERLQHGKPSGCDSACIVYGGFISYQLKFPPEITQIKNLPCHIDNLGMFVVFTGKSRDTKTLV